MGHVGEEWPTLTGLPRPLVVVRRVASQDKSRSQKTTRRTQEKRDSASAWESPRRGGNPVGGILRVEAVKFPVGLATGMGAAREIKEDP